MPPKKGPKAGSSRLTALPTEYPGKISGKGLEQPQWAACRAMLEGVYIAKNGSRYIGDVFRVLPDRSSYPDYYETIPEPESLDNIAAGLGTQIFVSPEAFFNQLQLVFLNAKHYNEEGSQIWTDANQLEEQVNHAWKTNIFTGVFPKSKVGTTHDATKGKGKAKKERVTSGTRTSATPAPTAAPIEEPRRSITLNIKPPLPPVKEAASSKPVPTPISASIPAPLPVQTVPPPIAKVATPPMPSPPIPTVPLPATLHSIPATSEPSPAVEQGPPGVNQFTTPAALIPPRNIDPQTLANRARQNQMDKELMDQFDRGLEKWKGPEVNLSPGRKTGGIDGSGWFGQGAPEHEGRFGGPSSYPARVQNVLHAVVEYRDTSGVRLSDALASMPEILNIPYLSTTGEISLDMIQQRRYNSLVAFDRDMSSLFERARRYHIEGSLEYGHVIVLQRLYNALTAPYPMTLPPSGVPAPSPTKFASLPAGPGTARPVHEITQDLKAGMAEGDVGIGITTFRVGNKDRIFTDEARHKGMAYKTGDYIHLINPDDAARPIVGQIFRTFVPTKGYKTHHVTVCWYFRPEQIVHRASRMFFDHEIFKTSHFCDHPVEDIIERIGCQFYVRGIRGRPRAPEWYPGWPLYICHSRYNDRGWYTVRIKNWASCIPDELRQTDFMQIDQWERIIDPPMDKSPFLRGIRGPGFFAEPREGGEEEEEEEGPPRRRQNTDNGTKRLSTAATASAVNTPSYRPYVPTAQANRYPTPSSHAASQSTPTNPAYRQPPPPASGSQQRPVGTQPVLPSTHGRTIAAMMGGPQVIDQVAVREYLPIEVARLFERDARNQVLWFSGPPLLPGQIKIPAQPTHSLEYLEYLTKRKNGSKSDLEAEDGQRGKRFRTEREPLKRTEDEKMEGVKEDDENEMWWAQGMSSEQIEKSLRLIIESA